MREPGVASITVGPSIDYGVTAPSESEVVQR